MTHTHTHAQHLPFYFSEAAIFYILQGLTWTVCVCLGGRGGGGGAGGKKQGLIHVNKRAVQAAAAAPRADSEE